MNDNIRDLTLTELMSRCQDQGAELNASFQDLREALMEVEASLTALNLPVTRLKVGGVAAVTFTLEARKSGGHMFFYWVSSTPSGWGREETLLVTCSEQDLLEGSKAVEILMARAMKMAADLSRSATLNTERLRTLQPTKEHQDPQGWQVWFK